MAWDVISKSEPPRVAPNLADYAAGYEQFSWDDVPGWLGDLPSGAATSRTRPWTGTSRPVEIMWHSDS